MIELSVTSLILIFLGGFLVGWLIGLWARDEW